MIPENGLNPPRQERSRKTLDRLVETSEALLKSRPFDELTVAELARRAGSSVGSFYARFAGKDAFLEFLDRRSVEELDRWWEDYFAPERNDGASLEKIVRDLVMLWVKAHRRRKGLLRTLFLRVRGRSAKEMVARTRQVNRRVVEGLRALVLARRDELRHPDPERGVLLGVVMVASAIREWVLFEDLRLYPGSIDDEALADELTRAFLGYLGAAR